MVDTLLTRFDMMTCYPKIPVSPVTELGPTTDNDLVTDRPFRQAVGGVIWLAGMTRPDIADAARAVGGGREDPRLSQRHAGSGHHV